VRDWTLHVYDHLADPRNPKAGEAACIQRAINDGRWKLHHYLVKGKETIRLFDLQNDPAEMHDLSQDGAASKEMARLAALLATARSEMGDNQM
jgi:arylsulfatase A-like enzyme